MRITYVYNNHFPIEGYTAMTLWPWVFIRKDRRDHFDETAMRHETTHALQQKELLWLSFFILYGLEYAVKLLLCGFDSARAYRSISFEQEAYLWQNDKAYNNIRPSFEWKHFIFRLYKKKRV